MDDRLTKLERFKALHEAEGVFLIPNPWDAGSAKILNSLGFDALATTSAGYAFALGKTDSFEHLSRDGILKNAREIVNATPLPVSADLQNGFGDDPETCAHTIRLAVESGLVGGSVEDATGDDANPIYEMRHSVDRVCAAVEAANAAGFVLTARAENHLFGRDDLSDTIKRLQAYSEAGAHVLYAPGLPDIDAIRTVCREVDKPVNVVMGLKGPVYPVTELAEAGVRRISIGGSFARAALGGLLRAAQEIKTSGTFTYASDAMSGPEIARIMSDG
ncbi:MAG: isocitrate lyase/phosphoenolpyruvate mutase family protein [Pseudomonadota bacterium]